MKRRKVVLVRYRTHVVPPDCRELGDASASLKGQIWWRLAGSALRICVRIAETVQRAIIVSTSGALEGALEALQSHGWISATQIRRIWEELATSEGVEWVPARIRSEIIPN